MGPTEVFRILTDPYSVRILEATYENPKTAVQLNREYDIPIAACYRRIKWLESAGLLVCTDRIPTKKDKRISIYASRLKKAFIYFDKEKLKLRVDLADGGVMNYE